jgi:hypothetical protein
MIDILELLHRGKMSVEDAYKLFENFATLEDVGDNQTWVEYFGFSEFEATGIAHGASLADLAKWRYSGWPSTCYRCGKSLDYTKYHWTVKEDALGQSVLVHIVCPEE